MRSGAKRSGPGAARQRIRVVYPHGVIKTVVGGPNILINPPIDDADLGFVVDVAVSQRGDVYIPDQGQLGFQNHVYRVVPGGPTLQVVAGVGNAGRGGVFVVERDREGR